MRRLFLMFACAFGALGFANGAAVAQDVSASKTARAPSVNLVVHHFTISAADVDALAKWYEDKLGFRLTKRFNVGDIQMAWLDTPNVSIHLVHVADSVRTARPNETLPQYMQNQGYRNLVFAVPDLDRAYQRMTGEGIVFLGPLPGPAKPATGNIRLAYFRDPEGNVLGICEDLDRSNNGRR